MTINIDTIVIQNNTIGKKSVAILNKILSSSKDSTEIKLRLKSLEINNCHIKLSLLNELTECLKQNRSLDSLNISGVELDKKSILNLSDFITNNYSLRKLTISWSQIKSNEFIFLMQKIKVIKHLQYLDISDIPFEGKISIELTSLVKDHIIFNSCLIHLDMSC